MTYISNIDAAIINKEPVPFPEAEKQLPVQKTLRRPVELLLRSSLPSQQALDLGSQVERPDGKDGQAKRLRVG